jgi:hypothetical protein
VSQLSSLSSETYKDIEITYSEEIEIAEWRFFPQKEIQKDFSLKFSQVGKKAKGSLYYLEVSLIKDSVLHCYINICVKKINILVSRSFASAYEILVCLNKHEIMVGLKEKELNLNK